MSKNIIKLENVYKVFKEAGRKEFSALRGIDLNIHEKEFVVLLGPSGSGKSTLPRIASGLDNPSSGKVVYGESVNKEAMSFVFQQSAVFPWLSVFKNVELGLIGHGVIEASRKKMVTEELKEFGLHDFAHAKPHELSGGMKQRVGLARAFVTNPSIIFLDEPFSELDFFTARELRKELLRLWKEHNATVSMVSHNIDEAIELADRIVVLSSNPGEIKDVVVNDLLRPRESRSKEFFDMQDRLYKLFD